VWCPVPGFVVAALESCPKTSQSFFFWTGESKPKSTVGDWQRSLRKLFRLTGVPDGHAHRFRNANNNSMANVAVLLGHQSVKVTERHYAPWVRARQQQLEADVRRTWRQDAVALREMKGTPEVHGKAEAVN